MSNSTTLNKPDQLVCPISLGSTQELGPFFFPFGMDDMLFAPICFEKKKGHTLFDFPRI
jgi:hypothetical protein